MSTFIEKIVVENLFGHYNYRIEKDISNLSADPLIIIYGDNGSGKTTILELIFNLLSTVLNAGHKSNIAKIKFEQFTIFLEGNIEIIAKRENAPFIGSYHFMIKEDGSIINNVFLEANDNLAIRIKHANSEVAEQFQYILKYINKLNISIHYLSDKRKLFTGIKTAQKAQRHYKYQAKTIREFEQALQDEYPDEEGSDLGSSIKILENWIKKHILQGSKAGDKNTNSIYTDLIKRVSTKTNKSITKQEVLDLVAKLIEIRNENKSYYKNGLVSKIETKEIEQALSVSTEYNLDLIYNVLEPYVEGVRGRLDSLKDIQKIITLFVEGTNNYLTNKTIIYHLSRGFQIIDNEFKEQIEFQMLSSGEKQLLLLFCNVITASDKASVFIIDEPEISLNIKWQRQLIQTLLDFSMKKNVQFEMFLIRLILELNGPFPKEKITDINRSIKITKETGEIEFCSKNHLHKILNNLGKTAEMEAFLDQIEEFRKILPAEQRKNIRGHDFIHLLFIFINKIKNNIKISEEAFERTIFQCIDYSMLKKETLFSSLEYKYKVTI